MRRGEVFWGIILIILGGLFALRSAGYLTGDIFGWFWPLFIVAIGVWILIGGGLKRQRGEIGEPFSIPLQGANGADLRIDHGAGRISIASGANSGDFLTGTKGLGMSQSAQVVGDRLQVKIEAGPSFIPFMGPHGGVWEYRLDANTPTQLVIHSGASRVDLGLADLTVTGLEFQGGASNLNLTLPTRVGSFVSEIEAGAASIEVRVPKGVGLRLHAKSIGSLNIDEAAFPRRAPDVYESADYESVTARADVRIDGGATSVRVVREAA
ncbi:MAG: LiaI-LiaF-like domain-containing protein [Anaerolineales bacterium]